MIGWLLLSMAVASDPVALRQLHGDPAAAAELGSDGLSVAADVGPLLAVTVDPGAWVGAAVGMARPLVGADRPWGVDATGAVGAAGLLATPGVALTATGALRGGVRSDRGLLTLGLVLPAAIRLDWPVEAIVPVGLELTSGVRLGEVWLGMRGQAGATLSPGGPPALRSGWGGWVRLPLGQRDKGSTGS